MKRIENLRINNLEELKKEFPEDKCSIHGIEKTNFWSNKRGGVIHGCPLCDERVEEEK
jgi:hypothetical protein